jgi:hypothetical protein
MATDESSDALTLDGETAPERAAAELGSIVADQVRAAIESAEQSAEELRRRALDDAATDRDQVHQSAAVVLGRIDAIEAQVTRLLDGVRDEVARIEEQADRAQDAPPPLVDPPSGSERPESHPDGSMPDADPPEPPERVAPRRRHAGLFGRRRRALPQCAVCGRTAEDGERALERWRRGRRTSLCPECQDEGWQVREGASVPYRSPRGPEPG